MKTKARIVLKSLADLPANLLAAASSLPNGVVSASKLLLAAPARVTRRELRAARKRSAEFLRRLEARACAPFRGITVWPRGGINE